MIKRIRNTRIIFLYILFLMSCTLSVSTLQVSAATKKGSIEIHYKGRIDSQGEVDLSGATFTLFQIQSAENGELVWNEEFASAGISLKDTSAGAREKQAKKLFDYAKKNDITGTTQETNTAGYTSFLNLEEGTYLLAQIGTVDSGTEQFESAPFLIEVHLKSADGLNIMLRQNQRQSGYQKKNLRLFQINREILRKRHREKKNQFHRIQFAI